MRFLALAAIRAYQRYLSPRKGFGCAYRRLTGRAGCSALGYRAIRRHGVIAGWAILRRRLARCSAAHRQLQRHGPAAAQAGFCDVGCDCDPGGLIDALDCAPCDCGCDWFSRKEKPPPPRGPFTARRDQKPAASASR